MTTDVETLRKEYPFGSVVVAMVTPFSADGHVDIDSAVALADRLIKRGCNGIVLNGTTGESPTTQPEEKLMLLKAVFAAVGDRAIITHGCGTYDTAESVEFAKNAQKVGCHGLLVVTPYYSRPPQEGLYQHFKAIADATDLPNLLYDIPPRSVVPIARETLLRLAEHPRILGVKDAKGDLGLGAEIIASTGLQYLSGDDPLNLPWLSVGGVGFVSVIGHVVADRLADILAAYRQGDVQKAQQINASLVPLFKAMARLGGVTFSKAALSLQGFKAGTTRLPQVDATSEQLDQLAEDLATAGVL